MTLSVSPKDNTSAREGRGGTSSHDHDQDLRRVIWTGYSECAKDFEKV